MHVDGRKSKHAPAADAALAAVVENPLRRGAALPSASDTDAALPSPTEAAEAAFVHDNPMRKRGVDEGAGALPPGWTTHTSKSSGKTFFTHADGRKTKSRPTE